MPVGDAAEAMGVRRGMAMSAQPFGPAQILIVGWRDRRSTLLGEAERGQWLVPQIDEDAKREQRGPPDPMLAMDKHAPARTHVLAREGHTLVEQVLASSQRVWSGKMKEGNTVAGECTLVVAAFLA